MKKKKRSKLLAVLLVMATGTSLLSGCGRKIAEKEDAHRAVCDYISGMSDGYAVDLYQELFIPKGWK